MPTFRILFIYIWWNGLKKDEYSLPTLFIYVNHIWIMIKNNLDVEDMMKGIHIIFKVVDQLPITNKNNMNIATHWINLIVYFYL